MTFSWRSSRRPDAGGFEFRRLCRSGTASWAGAALLREYRDGRHAHDGAQMEAIHDAPAAGIEASSRRRDAPR
jgi:hypothetical protein